MRKVMFHLHCLRKGGAERVVVNLAEQFKEHQYEVVIVLTHQAEDDYQISEGIQKQFAGLALEEEHKNGRLKNFLMRMFRLRSILIKEKPDIIIAFGKNPNYRTMLAKLGTGIPVIVSVRNDPRVDYVGIANTIFNKVLLERAEGCVFQTQDAQMFFSAKLREKSKIILNPLHNKYLNVRRQNGKREKRIVTVGRLAEQKNQLLLIQAFEQISKEMPEYILQIYGGRTQDKTADNLQQYVKEHMLCDKIVFMGIRDDLQICLPDAALFVLSSDYEGMPNVVMEAMAMGLPVIATDCPCGGPRTLIKDGINGILTPVGDKDALIANMRMLLRNEEWAEKIGNQAKNIREIANIDTIYKQWEEFVEETMQKNKKRDSN